MPEICRPCLAALCTRLREEKAKLQRFAEIDAKAANAAYEPYSPGDEPDPKRVPPPGFRNATDADLEALNIPRSMIENPVFDKDKGPSAFRAAVFINETTKEVLMAYQGTDFLSLEDWKNNKLQGLGQESDYYTRAQEVAKRAELASQTADRFDGYVVRHTGHSLGGGLASAAAAASGADATTFNAAGLHPSTVANPVQGSVVDAVNVVGEVLTTLQKAGSGLGVPQAAQTSTWPLDPPRGYGRWLMAAGALFGVKGLAAATAMRSVGLHLMGTVEDSLAQRRLQVAQALEENQCP